MGHAAKLLSNKLMLLITAKRDWCQKEHTTKGDSIGTIALACFPVSQLH
jgi:hypothetical protein